MEILWKKGRVFAAKFSHQAKFLFLSYIPIRIYYGIIVFVEESVTILLIF